MINTGRRPAEPPASDQGVAMILVVTWSMILLALALVVAQAVIRQVVPSTRSENSYSALAAAEAGIEDYRARLLVNGTYYSKDDPTNPALGGWAAIPGGDADSTYSYAIDAGRAATGGGLTIYSTGRTRGVSRTIVAVLARRSTLDYVYMSDIESTAPTMPAAYSSAAGSGGTLSDGTSITAQELAQRLCSRHWWDKIQFNGQVAPIGTGIQRNQNFCQWAGIYSGETLVGRVHTNDIWRLAQSGLTTVFSNAKDITSSCPSNAAEGMASGGVACPASHRFVSNTDTTVNPNNANNATWSSPTTAYQGNAWVPSGAVSVNPSWDSVLELPPDADLMLGHASDTGCVFTGPTRIRFTTEANVGYMYVTSPDTKDTSAACGGGTTSGLAGSAGVALPQATKKIQLDQFTNLVIYVQDVPRTGAADDPDNAYDLTNTWTAGTEPTCTYKSGVVSATGTVGTITGTGPWSAKVTAMTSTTGLVVGSTFTATAGTGSLGTGGTYKVTATTSTTITFTATGGTTPRNGSITNITTAGIVKYPYVIPSTAEVSPATNPFTTGKSTNLGFPSELADPTSAFYSNTCSSGDAYVQGTYKGQVTIATANNIIVTSNLITSEQTVGTSTGQPLSTSTSVLGLIANNFAYVYRPFTAAGAWVGDWPVSNATDIKINAAILAVNQCWGSQREFNSSTNGSINLWGSLAQKFRCAVGQNTGATISGGFSKAYRYDARFALQTPPYMVDLSFEPWKRNVYGEVTPVTQAVGTTTWPLLQSTDTSAVFSNIKVADGPATVSLVSSNQARVVATAAGLVVLSFDVTKSGITETRRLVITVT